MKIVFISHDASRTGAPILLLRLIKALKGTRPFDFDILLIRGGDLEGKFREAGKVVRWKSTKELRGFDKYNYRIRKKFGLSVKKIEDQLNNEVFRSIHNADVVFNNTITNGAFLQNLPLEGKKIITYIHELQIITARFTTKEQIEFLKKISGRVLVPSNAVRNFLVQDLSFDDKKISLLKYIINPPQSFQPSKARQTSPIFNIGLSGTLDWRKGYDILPHIAAYLIRKRGMTQIHFTWLGVRKNSLEYNILSEDLRKMDLIQWFTLLDPMDNVYEVMSGFDLYLLPSREDAFPLVVLEAASLGIPSVCFEHSGGITEFVEKDAGIAVEYMDVEAMAEAIIRLKENPELRRSMGETARGKAASMNNSNIVSGFWKVIDQL